MQLLRLRLLILGLIHLHPLSSTHIPHSAPIQRPLSSISASPSPFNPSFIFSSVHGLLRQLPNTFSPNGFSIAAGTVPAYTNLYHARKDAGDIPKVEWVAFDAEMSYGIMGGRGGETWLHTFVTTRDVRVLVFDGMSAALRESGTLDAQAVFLHGGVNGSELRDGNGPGRYGSPVRDEYERAEGLCKWARELPGARIEGFVRMNTGFEMIWCDFEDSDSWKLVSKLNVTAPAGQSQHGGAGVDMDMDMFAPEELPTPPPGGPGYGPGPPDGPPDGPDGPGSGGFKMPWAGASGWEWIRSATWHYVVPELRVIPDLCRFFTFYDPSFASFPHDLRTPKDSSHRLVNVTRDDAAAFRSRIGKSLLATHEPCSQLDWRRVAGDVMDRYGGRIRELQIVLASDGNATERAADAAKLAFAAVMPFVAESQRDGAQERCALAYTEAIPADALSPQEVLLRDAVEAVVGRICRTFLDVYFGYLEDGGRKKQTGKWRKDVDELVTWLDWDMWRRCEGGCAWGELCALALWPVLGLMDERDWKQPRCVNSSVVENGRGRRPRYPGGGGDGGGGHDGPGGGKRPRRALKEYIEV
ncbi:hypothetical protein BZA05DRAFT_405658 [Tricharina praecox]|uniref:uncharacterized protein n=1 Tax=Tricharina praecox TaxID=43433 RepID=UPI002220739C|nr:uncharacterized protein BZA05DRAFT_405658 [Tricharina praecox]KAI5846853.1 hypothetical protein BZA05DRAFT_405658 [Tricharina praecox]